MKKKEWKFFMKQILTVHLEFDLLWVFLDLQHGIHLLLSQSQL